MAAEGRGVHGWQGAALAAHAPASIARSVRNRYASDVFYLFACGTPEPVLRAVEPTPAAEAVAERRQEAELRATPEVIDVRYVKPEGVYVDVRYLAGRQWRSVRAEVEEQLGAVVEEREGAGGGQEVLLERGTIRLHDERIQMVEVPLPEPMRRSDAMAVLGLPPPTREYQAFSMEFRLLNQWGFRRIRFIRVEPGSEDIAKVQAWKFTAD